MSGRVRFLIGGVQKGGTTALDQYLRAHPALEMASIKEAHFFDDESVDWAAPDYAVYHRLFSAPDGLWGEATPVYLYWPQSLERIRRYDPDMKLIFLFRDPAGRAWSHWKMERDRGWETEPFAWCIREGRARLASADPPGFHRVFSYVERGFYAAQLARALSLFGREQMLLLRSEDLSEDPDAVVTRVCRFLDVAPPELPLEPLRANVAADNAPIDPVDADYLRGLYAEDLRRFAELSGLDVEGWASTPPAGAARDGGPSAAARS